MQNTLIIKTGAAGDVVRTTCLLNILSGNIYWIVDPKNQLLFPDNYPGLHILTPGDFDNSALAKNQFHRVISLEEETSCARMATSAISKELIGVRLNHAGLTYTDESSGWYDMSLISRKGKAVADALKKSNIFPFQHWLFNMVGIEFSNEPYVIYRNPAIRKITGLVGIESRVGHTWPNKGWHGYELLQQRLSALGYKVRFFEQRENVRDYLDDIATCSCVISGDSLAMHVALAYKIPCIGIFNCTPPNEIHDYGLLTKVVSPLLNQFLYQRDFNKEVVNSISVQTILDVFTQLSIAK